LDVYVKARNLQGSLKDYPFRYQGQYEDAELGGLYYNRHRYYDLQSGCYISADPISIAGGINVYAYVHDVNAWIDPLGLQVNLYDTVD
jgi:RHS repeat-associated protein